MGGAYSTHGEMSNAYKILVGKPEGKDRSEDLGVDGRMILQWNLEITAWEGVDWMHLA
jgi:hypothetical protein